MDYKGALSLGKQNEISNFVFFRETKLLNILKLIFSKYEDQHFIYVFKKFKFCIFKNFTPGPNSAFKNI